MSVDFSITNAYQSAYRTRANPTVPGEAAKLAEKLKNDKYLRLHAILGQHFHPLALEGQGRVGDASRDVFRQLIDKIVERRAGYCVTQDPPISRFFRRELVMAVHRAAALNCRLRVVDIIDARCRLHSWPWCGTSSPRWSPRCDPQRI